MFVVLKNGVININNVITFDETCIEFDVGTVDIDKQEYEQLLEFLESKGELYILPKTNH